ncbi:MAG: glutathione S-transferase family protein [Deltaproteobacteria bacterium]
MIELYGVARSRATRNLWLLYETEVEFKHIPVIQSYRLTDPEGSGVLHTRSPEFLAISPQGAIPVMKDGDFVLTESLAINLYLARIIGGELGPKSAQEDASMMQWALYAMTAIEPFTLPILYAVTQGRAETPEGASEIVDLRRQLERPMNVLEAHLATNGFVVGSRFTVADINTAEVVRYATVAPGFVEAYPAVKRWLAACHARPGFQKMWALRETEPA